MNWVYNKSLCLFVFVGRGKLCNNLVYNNVLKIKSDALCSAYERPDKETTFRGKVSKFALESRSVMLR